MLPSSDTDGHPTAPPLSEIELAAAENPSIDQDYPPATSNVDPTHVETTSMCILLLLNP